jgi:integrase
LPYFGRRPLAAIKPAHIREWDRAMSALLAASSRSVLFAHLRAILGAAVDDERIVKNPCSARSVTQPRPVERRVIPWTAAQLRAIRGGLAARYRPMVDLGGGCGLRQGEIFGLAPEDLDRESGWVHVRRQVKRIEGKLVFGLPKNDKHRLVPLPATVAAVLDEHMRRFPPVTVTLPWESPAGPPHTVRLLFTTSHSRALNKGTFNQVSWHPALRGHRTDYRYRNACTAAFLRLDRARRRGEHQGAGNLPRAQQPGVHAAGLYPSHAIQ